MQTTTEAKAKIITKQQEQEPKFSATVSKNPDDGNWKFWDNKLKFYDFMQYCIRHDNKVWIQKIAENAREEMNNKGYVKNPILGWCSPNDIPIAGVCERNGYWMISDTPRFEAYLEMRKKADRLASHAKYIERKRAESQAQEGENVYIDALLNNGDEPWM